MWPLLLYLSVLIIFSTIAWAGYSLAPWVPTRKLDLKRIKSLARLKPGEVFYDLGAGDGRVAAHIALQTKARAVGIEISVPFYLICKLRQFLSGNQRLLFKYKNLYRINLSAADVVYIFAQSPGKLSGRLERKLKQEMKAGSRVITYAFAIKGWKPTRVDKPMQKDISIYLYEIT